jgi:hypothetical protein
MSNMFNTSKFITESEGTTREEGQTENPVYGEVYSIQYYVIKFVSDLQQVSGFLRGLWFPPPIKLTTTI